MRGIGRLLISLHRLARGRVCSRPLEATVDRVILASHGSAEAPLERPFTQERSRVVPEGLRKSITHIGTGDADISEHLAVEARQHIGLATVTAGARKFPKPMGDHGQDRGKNPQQGAASQRVKRGNWRS